MTAEGEIGYVDSVAVADRTLGELRLSIEDAGLWERTALLVTADHGWRTKVWRDNPEWTREDEAVSHVDTSGVPFVLRLPGQHASLLYSRRFNTLLTRRLLEGILRGTLTTPAQVPAAIETVGASQAGK